MCFSVPPTPPPSPSPPDGRTVGTASRVMVAYRARLSHAGGPAGWTDGICVPLYVVLLATLLTCVRLVQRAFKGSPVPTGFPNKGHPTYTPNADGHFGDMCPNDHSKSKVPTITDPSLKTMDAQAAACKASADPTDCNWTAWHPWRASEMPHGLISLAVLDERDCSSHPPPLPYPYVLAMLNP